MEIINIRAKVNGIETNNKHSKNQNKKDGSMKTQRRLTSLWEI
jgi:hypothetical protein